MPRRIKFFRGKYDNKKKRHGERAKSFKKDHIWNFKKTKENVNIEAPVVEVVRNEIRRKKSILLVKKRLQNDLVSSCKNVFVETITEKLIESNRPSDKLEVHAMCSLVAESFLQSSQSTEATQLKKLMDKVNDKYTQELKRNYLLVTGDNKVDNQNQTRILAMLVASGDFTLAVLNTHIFSPNTVLSFLTVYTILLRQIVITSFYRNFTDNYY